MFRTAVARGMEYLLYIIQVPDIADVMIIFFAMCHVTFSYFTRVQGRVLVSTAVAHGVTCHNLREFRLGGLIMMPLCPQITVLSCDCCIMQFKPL